MTINCFKKCGEVCQRRIGSAVLAFMGLMSLVAMLIIILSWW